jgi:hypothetical protein
MHQESRGLANAAAGTNSGSHDASASPAGRKPPTPGEAIRRAMLLPAGKAPGWLKVAAADAERKLDLPEPVPGG